MNRSAIVILLALATLAAVLLVWSRPSAREYRAEEYGFAFTYPAGWPEPQQAGGNAACPEEDTYRTPDTLHLYGQEYRFPDRKLPGSESFFRSGIRAYRLPEESDGCNDSLIRSLARKDFAAALGTGMAPVSFGGLYGVRNGQASRLDTELRVQYLLFRQEEMLVLQPYLSFVPVSGSPEWQEISAEYQGNLEKYLREGDTAGTLREAVEAFHAMAQSLRVQ